MDTTQIVIDNTTFASAGRAIYFGDVDVKGGRHADDYYQRFKDQRREDIRSFLEFLTALLLFDQLLWNGSSSVQERKSMPNALWNGEEASWVYSWFPLFWDAAKQNVIKCRVYEGDHRIDEHRLHSAQRVAIAWVGQSLKQKILPSSFRTPIVYSDPDHHNRWRIEVLMNEQSLELTDDEIALALFLSQGLFYQSEALSERGLSYLPHSYRAVLLSDPEIASLSLACSEQIIEYSRLKGTDVMKEIQRVFAEELKEVQGGNLQQEFGDAIAIAGAFLKRTKGNCKGAFQEVMEFRDRREGKRLREQVKELTALAENSKLLPLKARLGQLRKELQDIEREQLGHASQNSPDIPTLMNLMEGILDNQGFILKPMISLIPLEAREALTKIGNITFFPSGFQLIFRHYFM